jgi:hypothetical protein
LKYLNFLVGQRHRALCHFSNLLSAILALKTFSPNPIIQKIIEILFENFTNTFVFLWIPSHCGIRENEYIDQLAKNSITKSKNESFRSLAKDFRQKVNLTGKRMERYVSDKHT